jgi:hypothetical protein
MSTTLSKESSITFSAFMLALVMAAHVHMYGRPRGRLYYLDYGFVLIVIANFCLGVVTLNMALCVRRAATTDTLMVSTAVHVNRPALSA